MKKVAKPAKKAAKPVKKAAPAKKVAAKPAKVEVKKDLTADDVRLILGARDLAERQKHVLAEIEKRGIKSIKMIPKKENKELVEEALSLIHI